MWLPYPNQGFARETILPANPNEVASLQIPAGKLRALPQSSRGGAWEGKRRGICPPPGRTRRMVQSRYSHCCLDGAFWQLCKQPQGGLERVSAPAFDKSDTAVEITTLKLVTGFKGAICRKVIILLLVLGFSLPSQIRRQNSLLFSGVYFLPSASLPVSPLISPSAFEPIHFPSVACPLEEL